MVNGRDDYGAGVGTLFLECASRLPPFTTRDGGYFPPSIRVRVNTGISRGVFF